jgi:tetratricopeptide (TPR) repeat protein
MWVKARAGWSVLVAVATVGLVTWWALSFDGSQWVKNSVLVGAAVVAAFAPSYVDWVLKRAADRRRREDVLERPLPETKAGLLRADRFIVPFTGRDAEYADLREWCRDDKPPVRLVVGAGGVGKTRLALHLGEYLKSCGWSVMVVAAGKEAVALPTTRATTRRSIFLIVDYAETRTDLVGLLRSVAGHPDHVRVLLIARSVGDWWWHLRSDVAAVRGLVRAYPPLMLSAQVDSARRPVELVHAAVPHFAAVLNVRAPTQIEVTVPDEVPLLVLHAAALLAVLRSQDHHAAAGQLVADLGVLDELLGHERRHWEHSANRAGLGHLSPAVLQRAVAVACLFGAVDEAEGAKVLRRVPNLRDDESLRRNVARWLRQLYPPGSGYWGSLQPELVAEAHVIEQLVDCPELIKDLPELRTEQTYQMLTVLSTGATYQSAGLVLLEKALRADIEQLVFSALEVATTAGGELGSVLAQVLADVPLPLPTLVEIEATIPYPTTALAGAAVAVTRRILDALSTGVDLAETARWHAQLGVVLAQAGRSGDAVVYIDTAVGHYRTLIKTGHNCYLPDLARSLHSLGIRLAEQGRHADALPYTEQAVEYYRMLVKHSLSRYQSDLAASLNNLGIWLAELGRHAEAFPPLDEAVECYQALYDTDPDRYLHDLAQAETNRRLSQSRMPRHVEPLPHLEAAVERNRALAETDRDRYLPDLVRSLHNLGNGYAEQKRLMEAVDCLTEALTYYRTLDRANPDRHRSDLAACLNNLGVNLAELGRYADAVPCAEEAVDLHRCLAGNGPARYRSELARSLDNLVMCLSRMDRHVEVLPPAEEAVKLHRLLATIDPDRYRPELARALTNLSVSLTELSRYAEALPAAEEAVAIYRHLLATDPHQYRSRFALALRNCAVDLSGLRRHAQADRCRQEADRILDEEAS